jgi:hypothetical protein
MIAADVIKLNTPDKAPEQANCAVASGSPPWPVVVSYGGGDNSRAMLIEMQRRGVIPDLIQFADTGGETPDTYENNEIFSAWLVAHGMPEIITVRDERQTLESEVLAANTMPSLVFGFRSCSDKYKVRPQERYLKTWQPAIDAWASGGKVVKLIGYDAGEVHRVADYNDKRFMVEYPLVRWGWRRKDCAKAVLSAGLRLGKSSCFYCPAMKKHEVISLSVKHPALFARAVEMERNATAATTAKGLGRNWSWEQLVKADAAQAKLFDELPDMVPCGCYDGGSSDPANNQVTRDEAKPRRCV